MNLRAARGLEISRMGYPQGFERVGSGSCDRQVPVREPTGSEVVRIQGFPAENESGASVRRRRGRGRARRISVACRRRLSR